MDEREHLSAELVVVRHAAVRWCLQTDISALTMLCFLLSKRKKENAVMASQWDLSLLSCERYFFVELEL